MLRLLVFLGFLQKLGLCLTYTKFQEIWILVWLNFYETTNLRKIFASSSLLKSEILLCLKSQTRKTFINLGLFNGLRRENSFLRTMHRTKFIKIWLLPFSVKSSQNKVFSIICVTLLSSLFQTWKALFMIKSFSYQRPKIWDLVPKELKELSSSSAFENAIKKWKTQNWM